MENEVQQIEEEQIDEKDIEEKSEPDEIKYEETQNITAAWLWTIVIITAVAVWVVFVTQVILKLHFGSKPIPSVPLFFAWLVSGMFVPYALSSFKLITQIREKGIYVSYPPMRSSFIIISYQNIEKCYVREYNAKREYGGTGIMKGESGLSYSMSGKMGVQLELKDGKKILIGSQKPEELCGEIEKMIKLKQV